MSDEVWVKLENGKAAYPPENKDKTVGATVHVNYWLEEDNLTAAGYEQKTQEEIDAYIADFEAARTAAFRSACEKFREICAQIQAYFELEAFTGGFDEMPLIQTSDKFLTIQGQVLAQSWSAANLLCTYEAAKIGLGQPDWWYQCWQAASDAESGSSAPLDDQTASGLDASPAPLDEQAEPALDASPDGDQSETGDADA